MLTIYKASAGSGKTYTLAYEYVRLLLGVKSQKDGIYRLNSPKYLGGHSLDARHRNILAITFTNKATEEMKSRIIKELGALSAPGDGNNEDSPYAADLVKEFGCTRDELREVAARALKSLLFDYHHFNVSTIDSFFQTVLRAFAREVDRQGDYGLELNDEFAVTAGIGMMLDDLNYGNPPRRDHIMHWIRNYTLDLVENGKDGSMFNRSGTLLKNLSKYVQKMGSEVFKQSAESVLSYLEDPRRMHNFISAVDRLINDSYSSLTQRAREIIGMLDSSGYVREVLPSTVWKIFRAVTDREKINIADAFEKVGVKKVLDWRQTPDNSFYVKSKIPGKNKIYPSEAFSEALCDWMNDCRRAMARNYGLAKIRDACPNLEFLGYTWHYINRFREENNLILLSDTHDLLQRIINGSDTPFIYERIGVCLHHFLIDEFQDTSHMQWQNLKPLVAESLALDCDNLIIGDEKQAIYRFRNSDSSLLHHIVAQHDFPNDHRLRGNRSAENTNYRSAAGIVRFNNTLFSRIARNCRVEGYENTVQSISPAKKDLGAYISIYDTSSLAPVNDMPAEFDLTAREIMRQHEAGYRWSDIAVLVRRRSEAEAMVNYLMKYYPSVNILSDEALLLRNSPAVKLVISMLKLVDESYSAADGNKTADNSGAPVYATAGDIRLMISRYEYFSSEGHSPLQSLKMALEPSLEPDGSTITQSIIDIRSAHPSGLLSLVETIIAKKVPEARRRREYAYLAAFQDEVIKYCSSYNPSVHAFLSWWADASSHLAINSATGQDAVSVMTVHKSKGLQWACVHVPFGDWELVRSHDSVWISTDGLGIDPEICPPLISVEIDKTCTLEGCPLERHALRNRYEQLTDNLNTTYVAYTRPERELSICFAKHIAAGEEVLKAVSMHPGDDEDPQLCMDLASSMLHDGDSSQPGLIFAYGEPTKPQKRNNAPIAGSVDTAGDYRIFFREDTAALTSIDDATSEIGDIISDRQPAALDTHGTGSEDPSRILAAERGIHLHSIMADIDSPHDVDEAVERLISRTGIDKATAHDYGLVISTALSKAKSYVDKWFSPDADILKEQSIFLPEGDATFRPDRIVFHPDGTVEIIDYKFTAEPLHSHMRQIEAYTRLLRDMGYAEVKGFLWYPELNIIKEI